MLGRSHVLLAVAGYVALAVRPLPPPLNGLVAPVPTLAGVQSQAVAYGLGLFLVAVGSLCPDIDRAGSTIARVAGLPSRAMAWIVEHSFGHRGPLHSALAVALVLVLGQAFVPLSGIRGLGGPLAFGWASHIILDALTARGVPVLWPLRARLRLPPGFATGSSVEQLVLGLGLAGIVFWAFSARVSS
jgi:inner membrane protein